MQTPKIRRNALLRRFGIAAVVVALGVMPGATALGSITPKPATFGIHGTVSGLYPGSVKPFYLSVTNPWPYGVTVTSITTTVSSASARCTAYNLRVSRYLTHLWLPAHSTRHPRVTATLLHSAPNACQRARFPLVFHGTAVRP